MNPRKPLSLWQKFAQGPAFANSGFAPTRLSLQDSCSGGRADGAPAPDCCPFPFNWLNPVGVGPIFSHPGSACPRPAGRDTRASADAAEHGNLPFVSVSARLGSGTIRNQNWSSFACSISRWPWSALSSPAACRPVFSRPAATRPCAPLAVLRLARLSRTQPVAARPRARSSALFSAACPAASRAFRPADRLNSAPRGDRFAKATRAHRPGGLFHSRPGQFAPPLA